jgi:hypothetical protein
MEMMKKIALLAAATLSLLVAACQIPGSPQSRSGLTLHWNSGRTILPSSYPVPSSYDITLSSPGQTTITNTVTETSGTFTDLAWAPWLVEVVANDSSGTAVAKGSATFDLTSNHNLTDGTITLRYLARDGVGNMTLHLALSSPPDSATLSLTSPDRTTNQFDTGSGGLTINGNQVDFSLNGTPAGSYNAFFQIMAAGKLAMKQESVVVVVNGTTEGTIPVADTDFGAAFVGVDAVAINQKGSLPSLLALQDYKLDYTVSPSTASNKFATWASDNPAVAAVDPDGLVHPLALGTANISVTTASGAKIDTVQVTVISDYSTGVLSGLQKLAAKDFDGAHTDFLAALTTNSNDNDAKVWASLLDLAALPLHSNVQDLMVNKIGVVGYPTTMNDFFSNVWLTGIAYDYIRVQPTNGTTGNLVRGHLENGNGTFSVDAVSVNGNHINVNSGQMFVPDPSGDVYAKYWSTSGPGTVNASVYLSQNGLQGYSWDPNSSSFTNANGGSLVRGRLDTGINNLGVNGFDQFNNASTLGYGFIPDETGDFYASNWQVRTSWNGSDYLMNNPSVQGYEMTSPILDSANPQFFPEVQPLTGFVPDLEPVNGGYGLNDWGRIVMGNVINRNLTGFNGVVDSVLSGPYGSALDTIVARLKTLDDTARSRVPDFIIKAFLSAAHAPSDFQMPVTVSFGKAELLLLAASLETQKAFVQYLSSVDVSYSFGTEMVNFINQPTQTNLEAFYNASAGFYNSSLLTDRSGSTGRSDSRSTFVTALGTIQSALNLYLTALNDSTTNYYTDVLDKVLAQIPNAPTAADAKSTAITALTNANGALSRIATAISTNVAFQIPSSTLSSLQSGPNALVGSTIVWPDENGFTGQVASVYPAEIWNNNMLNLRNWVDTSTGKMVFYTRAGNDREGINGSFKFAGSLADEEKMIPADLTTMDAAYYGFDTLYPTGLPATGNQYLYLRADTGFWLTGAMINKVVPGTTQNDTDVIAFLGFGPGWDLVTTQMSQDSSGTTDTYTWTLPPGTEATDFMAWVNK